MPSIIALDSFSGTNGKSPFGGLVQDSGGNLFGTTISGGPFDDGTVFEVQKGIGIITTLAVFSGSNGQNPYSGLGLDVSGNLFGSTYGGGASNDGTVFEVQKGSGTITTLATFSGANGRDPGGDLALDSSGNLFGTTLYGGASDEGTAFEVQKSSGTATPLASFNGTNGSYPESGLVLDSSGNLFGTTGGGGSANEGTVFELKKGSSSVATLANFNGTNGATPDHSLGEDSSGNLFGITDFGGAGYTGGFTGYGTAFEVLQGSGTVTTLAAFHGTDVAYPSSSLVEDSSGNFFGTAGGGGAANHGTVFEVQHGSGTISTIASFNGTNGATPGGDLVEDAGGNLFGTAQFGGVSNDGTVFEVTAPTISTSGLADGTAGVFYGRQLFASGGTGTLTFSAPAAELPPGLSLSSTGVLSGTPTTPGSYGFSATVTDSLGASGTRSYTVLIRPAVTTFTTLAPFSGGNGAHPVVGLALDSFGDLFGATLNGGVANDGTVFEVQRGSGTITTLATFNGPNGNGPYSGLALDGSGNLFGTTENGGTSNDGIVFEVPIGAGLTTIATFNRSNGSGPNGLLEDSSGNLFGTTLDGGPSDDGTVFEVQHGSGSLTVLASFYGTNGTFPYGGVVEDSSGNLFGTTEYGGAFNDGTVFEVQHGSGTATIIGTFYSSNGSDPTGGLVEDSGGNVFGTTQLGGASGVGTVFEVPQGSGTVYTLASFSGANGAYPTAALIEDSSGNLFGTAPYGGVGYTGSYTGNGTVFELRKGSGTITTLATFTGTNGANPMGGVIEDSSGNLFGTAFGGGPFGYGTVFELPAPAIATASLASGTAGTGYSQTINSYGGTGALTFSTSAGILPPGLTLISTGVLWGTPTTAGSYSFTVTATDTVGASTSRNYSISISAAAFSQYLVTVLGSSTVQAGSPFQVTVQAADNYGNLVTSYTGPATVTASISPVSAGSFPSTVSINGSGFGYFLGNVLKVGSYTLTVGSGSFTGSAGPMNVITGSAVKLSFGVQPVNTPTGVTLPPVTVQVLDAYGNVVTSDNTDAVTVTVASGSGSFTPGSTTTAMVTSGVATFANLTLTKPGSYQLSATVPALYIGPNSAAFTIAPLQVLASSFAATPSGFSLAYNAPYLVNSETPALYGQGFGATAPVPSVTLTQIKDSHGNAIAPIVVEGSLVLNPAANSLTFVATNTASMANNGTPLLSDGTYLVDLRSSAATNGFQAVSGGGFLDGLGTGTPGSGDYTSTFTVSAQAAHDDVVWVPDVSEGPGQPLNAPGANRAGGGGYPVYLDDSTGSVTIVQVTLNYNPALLTVTGTTGAGFALQIPSPPGHARLRYSGPALPAGTQTPIGFVTAMVPSGTSSIPIPYKAKDLLQLSNVSLNGGTIPAVNGDALHLVAYVADADGNGSYSSNDAVLITRVALQTDSGFASYPLVDPVIVADTDGVGFIPADAALQANEAGVGFPAANLATPPIPPGVHFQVVTNNGDRTLSMPRAVHAGPGGTVTLPVNLRGQLMSAEGTQVATDTLTEVVEDSEMIKTQRFWRPLPVSFR